MLISLLMILPGALALDPMPSTPIRFDGSVTVDSEAVEDGTPILVKAGDLELVSTTTLNSKYSVHVPTGIDLEDVTEYTFYIASDVAGIHRVPMAGAYVLFDLKAVHETVTEETPITVTEEGGSSGGGGGNSAPINPLTVEYQTFQISVGRGKAFQLVDQSHSVTVDSVSGKEVKLTIRSDPITIILSEGESREVDIDSEADYLLNVRAAMVSGSTANIEIKQVARPMPVQTQVENIQDNTIGAEESEEITEQLTGFAAVTGAVSGLSELPILENIYWIIAVFICVVVLILLLNKSTRAYLRKVLQVSNGETKE